MQEANTECLPPEVSVGDLVDLLGEVQYNGKSEVWTHVSVCPICKTIKPDGNGNSGKHHKSCRLNNLLNILEKM